MRINGPLGYVLTGSAVLTLLAGCSGGGSSSAPTPLSPQSTLRSSDSLGHQGQLTSVLRPGIYHPGVPNKSAGFADSDAKSTGAVVVSDAGAGTVDVFSTTGKPVATITGFTQPQGLTADAAGNIYVANTGGSNIPVYKNDYKTLVTTLQDPNQYPVGLGYDASTGNIGVTNIISTAGGPGSVSIYAKGSTTPCVTVSNSSFARVYFGGYGAFGWFYVDGQDPNGVTVVGVVKNGCKATTIDSLTTTNPISFPGGIKATTGNKIAIDDQLGPVVYTYNLPQNHTLGAPIATTPLTGASDPVSFSFTPAGTALFAADAGLAQANEYKYPAGGSPVLTISGFSQPIDTVVTPVEKP